MEGKGLREGSWKILKGKLPLKCLVSCHSFISIYSIANNLHLNNSKMFKSGSNLWMNAVEEPNGQWMRFNEPMHVVGRRRSLISSLKQVCHNVRDDFSIKVTKWTRCSEERPTDVGLEHPCIPLFLPYNAKF